jgi:hypothetical protein
MVKTNVARIQRELRSANIETSNESEIGRYVIPA